MDPFLSLPVAGAASLLLLLLLLLRCVAAFRRSSRGLPPLAGTVFHQFLNVDRLYDYHTDLSRRYRTFRILATPTCSYLYTTDPANVEHILKTNFNNYGKGGRNHDNLSTLFGKGIFAVDGEAWRRQRKLASYEFSTKVLRDFSSGVFRDNAVKLAAVISDQAGSDRTFDIQDLLLKSTLDTIFKVGFGVDLGTLVGESRRGWEFARAFDDSNEQTFRRYLDVFWKVKRFLNVGSEAKLKKDMELIRGLVRQVISSKAQQLSPGRADTMGKEEDILSRFLMERSKDPEGISDELLQDMILNFIIAGRDTTAATLSWFFYMLCKNQRIQERIVEEIEEATSTNMEKESSSLTIAEFSNRLTEQALSSMHYLHATLTETLRLYPAVAMDGKYCCSDDTLPDGHKIRKGDMIDFQPYCMGRMEFLWGDDACKFKPERWLDDDGCFRPESPYKFTAFQSGPRICLGKEFAYRQMKIFAATLLNFFRFKLADERKAVKYRVMLTLQIDGGLHLLAAPR